MCHPVGWRKSTQLFNNKEQTFKWLQAALDDHAVRMSYLAVDPVFDRFREDQRFQDLLRRVAKRDGLWPGSLIS
jgi:hypothetical protein